MGEISPIASLSFSKGNSEGTEMSNVESDLSASGTATVITADTLSLKSGILTADRVVQAGSLSIESERDTAEFKSKQSGCPDVASHRAIRPLDVVRRRGCVSRSVGKRAARQVDDRRRHGAGAIRREEDRRLGDLRHG